MVFPSTNVMIQLHSTFQTVMQRRIVPAFVIALNVGVIIALLIPPMAPLYVIGIAVAIQLQILLIYALIYRSMVSPTSDSVVVEGGVLHVRRSGHQVTIPLSSIAGVRGKFGLNPETITIDLMQPTEIGSSVTFIPPARLPSSKDHPMITTLRQLIAEPRQA